MLLRRRLMVTLLLAAAPVAAAGLASPASAAPAAVSEGCRGVLSSYSSDGSFIDLIVVPGVEGGPRDPFRVDPDGTLAWGGAPDSDIRSGAWTISVMGLDLAHGTVGQASAGMTVAGVLEPARDAAPAGSSQPLGTVAAWALDSSAYFPVTFTLEGAESACSATVWVGGVGQNLTTPMFWAAVLLGVLGVIFGVAMVLTTRAHTVIDIRSIPTVLAVPTRRDLGATGRRAGR